MNTIRVVLTAAGLALAAHAGAQTFGNPGGLSPDTPGLASAKPSADHANTQDKLFARQAALGGRAEVELSKKAQQKASADPVRSFAKRMVEDHGKSNDRLMKLARGVKAEIPQELDSEQKALASELDKKSAGKDYDLAYLAAQIQNHQRTANLLQYQLSFGQNEPLRKYAADSLPVVLEHLEMAKHHYALLTSAPST
jgi:putative membrane protein